MPSIRIGIGVDKRSSGKWKPLYPAGFVHPMYAFEVGATGRNAIITNRTINDFRTTYASPTVKYLDWQNGVDTNDGNTPTSAYKTLVKLVSVSFNRAYVAAGNYSNTAGTNIFTAAREAFGTGGKAGFLRGSTGDLLTWTDKGGGYFSVSTTLVPTVMVDTAQVDSDGDPLRMVAVADEATVASTPNSYWKDAGGGVLYVHLTSGLQPSNNLCIVTAAVGITAGIVNYGENLRFYGISCSNATATKNTIALKNCQFIQSGTQGISMIGRVESWLEDCVAYKTGGDGISYNITSGLSACGVEVNCITRDNGISTSAGASNGTTTHGSCVVLRLNGHHTKSEGPCVADSATAKTLNLNVTAGDSVSAGAAITKCAFASSVGSPQATEIWLDNCRNINTNGTYGAAIVDTTNAIIHVRKSNLTNVEANTVLTPY